VKLAVATYNIHRCIGTDRRYDAPRVATVLKELDCVLVALQEVENRGDPCHDSLQLDYLAASLDMLALPGLSIIRHRGPYGNALLTNLPVMHVERHDLSVKSRETRGAVEAVVQVEGRPLRAIAAHLGLKYDERRFQAARLLQIVRAEPTMPSIVLGDMNEWIPGVPWMRSLERELGAAPAPRTFPAARPILRLDRIWAGPAPVRVQHIAAHGTALARVASDHLPVRAEISLPDMPPAAAPGHV
jgi:endonuclease/exonuclease/phosphatase family metal-dependent hydrolase